MRSALVRRARPGLNRVKTLMIPAPTGGWDAVSSLSDMPEDRAIVLDNWFPKNDGVHIRRGRAQHENGMGSGVIDSLLIYEGITQTASKMFAVTGNKFYDASSSGTAGAASLSGLASNRWRDINFTTSAGKFLLACNGLDPVQMFDGAAWTVPVITGISSSDVINLNAYKGRVWFILRDSTKAAYLTLDAVAGVATTLELGSYFTKGGYLRAMATWSRDGGLGPNDYSAFISSEGQITVFVGTDPSSSSTWSHVGTYNLGRPIGYDCFTKVADDIALLCEDGIIPISKGLNTDQGAAAGIAITKNINNAMNMAARSYANNFGWKLTPYSKGIMALLNVPIQEGQTQYQYVMNTLTGAWCRFTGWNFNCLRTFKGNLYGGGNDGKVYLADTGGTDAGTAINAVGQGAYNYYKSRDQKRWNEIQPFVTTDQQTQLALGLSTDFRDNAVLGTPAAITQQSAQYDNALYDTDVYAVESQTLSDWQSIDGEGTCAAIHFRAVTNATGEVILNVNGFNTRHEPCMFA